MVKRKYSDNKSSSGECSACSCHSFDERETTKLREQLLKWYDCNKRDLPWRKLGQQGDVSQKSYAVWVSEIMLQQTQVATVIDYYNKWMKKWPTVKDLSKASLEEVNEMWSGLGYYSRGRRLHEGAMKVVKELNGEMPQSAAELLKHLPGVGRYTAGAIASIAQGQVTGVVDGNVMRVFSRMRVIGADITSQTVTEHIWSLANHVVDATRPGDFNQALMELGATVCTPRSPLCGSCPVADLCLAYKQIQKEKAENASKLLKSDNNNSTVLNDIEDVIGKCSLCLPADKNWDSSEGVQLYPRKAKKKAAREGTTAVCILCRDAASGDHTEYLIVQRPETGLLAGLWELPSVEVSSDQSDPEQCHQAATQYLAELVSVDPSHLQHSKPLGQVVHLFSHIHQTYMVGTVYIGDNIECKDAPNTRWVSREEFHAAAVSTAMKKVFKLLDAGHKRSKGNKTTSSFKGDGKKQLGLHAFFKPKST